MYGATRGRLSSTLQAPNHQQLVELRRELTKSDNLRKQSPANETGLDGCSNRRIDCEGGRRGESITTNDGEIWTVLNS